MDESFLEEDKSFKSQSKKKNKKISRTKYQAQRRKKMRRTRLRPWAFVVFCIIFVVIIVVNLLTIFDWGKDNKKIDDLEEEIKEITTIKEVEEVGETINPPVEVPESDYWYYIKVPFHDVDFTGLLAKNPDTIAYINVKGTNINYPVVQTSNNDYYLTHAFDKSYNDAGWVYMDYRNSNQFNDFNTIIYGHGRLNKTVFGSLRNLLNKSWQNNKDNYTMTISTPTMNYVYQIFSIYTIESETYYIKTKFSSVESKTEWINTMNQRDTSIIDSPANVEDKIITLSTCLNDDGGRVVVHAKLIKQQNKEAA